jgi:putative ABC transport system permease protein
MQLLNIKFVLRHLLKHKSSTIINVLCLTIGIVVSAFIFQYVFYELSYDKHIKEYEHKFRLKESVYNKGSLSTETVAVRGSIGIGLKNHYPEVEDFVRIFKTPNKIVMHDDLSFKESKIFYTTKSFFNIFTYKILQGKQDKLLEEPFHIVITEEIAQKYFGNKNPIGESIKFNNRTDYIIEAVCETPPENTHLKFDFLISWSTWNILYKRPFGVDEVTEDNLWDYTGFYTYLKLHPDTDLEEFEKKMASLVDEKNGDELKEQNAEMIFNLQPLDKLHLFSDYSDEFEINGNWKTTYLLFIVALLILIIAWINYINLSTSRAIDRAKEVGLKKVLGSNRGKLIVQFLIETFFINFISIILSIILIQLLIPTASILIGKQVNFTLLFYNKLWYIIMFMYVICSIAIGYIVGFGLSSFQPIKVLKGKYINSTQGVFIRKSLVVFQFIISLVLIASTIIIYKQISFMQNHDKNFNSENIIVLPKPIRTDSLFISKRNSFETEIENKAYIKYQAVSSYVPGQEPNINAGGVKFTGANENTCVTMNVLTVGYNFKNVFELSLKKGRFFSKDFGNDKNCILLNEEGMKLMGYSNPDSILNKKISFWENDYKVIGIIENFNHEALKKSIEPTIFALYPDYKIFYSLKLKSSKNHQQAINEIGDTWKNNFPLVPFEYYFMDDLYQQQYKSEKQFGNIFFAFSLFAIIIAALGLYGSASYAAFQRIKEVGIRKTLGASNFQIISNFLIDDLKLIFIAIICGIFLCFYLMSNWLMNFAYHLTINFWMLLIPSIIVIFISLLTVSSILLKTAKNNPIESLRAE